MADLSFSSLKDAMQGELAVFNELRKNVMKDVVRAVDIEIVNGTPVDTGLARSNWIVSVGVPVDLIRQPYAPGDHLGVSEHANALGAINQMEQALSSFIPGQTVYLQNSVDYIGLLNAGSSRQAPSLFVELGIIQGVDKGFSQVPGRIQAVI